MTIDSGHKPVLHKKHVARLQREQQQSKIILYAFIGIVVVVLVLLAYGYYDINYLQRQRPVAKVGKYAILVNQFEPRVRMQRQQLLAQYNQYSQYGQMFGMDVQDQLDQIQAQLDAPETIGQTVLDQLINEQLIRLEAEKRGITISDAEMVDSKESSFAYYPNGTPTAAPTATEIVMPEIPAEAFKVVTITPTPTATLEPTATETPAVAATATLVVEATATTASTVVPEPTATPYTQAGFETRFSESQNAMMNLGLSEKDYLALFETQILQKKVEEAITADLPHTEKQVWARHILVPDEAAATTVIERLKNGEDFATLAKELSSDGSAANGGDLGWFSSGAMVPEFEAAAFALEKSGDYTTTPVKSQFGYHIIQLIAQQDRPLTADQYDTAKNKAFSDWLTAARDTFGVEIFDLWKQYVPTEPNFISVATDAIGSATAAAKNATATPAP
jgi:parvulin-like peptidyl-prolyl isomerase